MRGKKRCFVCRRCNAVLHSRDGGPLGLHCAFGSIVLRAVAFGGGVFCRGCGGAFSHLALMVGHQTLFDDLIEIFLCFNDLHLLRKAHATYWDLLFLVRLAFSLILVERLAFLKMVVFPTRLGDHPNRYQVGERLRGEFAGLAFFGWWVGLCFSALVDVAEEGSVVGALWGRCAWWCGVC